MLYTILRSIFTSEVCRLNTPVAPSCNRDYPCMAEAYIERRIPYTYPAHVPSFPLRPISNTV